MNNNSNNISVKILFKNILKYLNMFLSICIIISLISILFGQNLYFIVLFPSLLIKGFYNIFLIHSGNLFVEGVYIRENNLSNKNIKEIEEQYLNFLNNNSIRYVLQIFLFSFPFFIGLFEINAISLFLLNSGVLLISLFFHIKIRDKNETIKSFFEEIK